MRKSLLTTIAAAALIAGAGLATAQQMPERTRSNDAQGYSEPQPGAATNASERQPGAMESQGQSAATEQRERRSGQPAAMESQGRSAAAEQKEHRSGRPGALQGPAQGRFGAAEEKEHRAGQPGAMQSRRRSAATEEREHRSGQPGAMGPVQRRSASEQNRGGVSEHRSVASINMSSDQKTRLHDTVTGGELRRVDHVDFALSAGTRVPGNVEVYPVPETIVEIIPQYRGFDYIVVGDDLIIINPGTLMIVAVVPV